MSDQHRLQFPGEVDGIPNPGVHALATHWTVDMSCITHQKHTIPAEVFGDAVMDAVR